VPTGFDGAVAGGYRKWWRNSSGCSFLSMRLSVVGALADEVGRRGEPAAVDDDGTEWARSARNVIDAWCGVPV
jgi:hypothetical protein